MSDKSMGYSWEVVVTNNGSPHVRPAAQLAQLMRILGGGAFIDGVSADSATELMAAGFHEDQKVTISSPNPGKHGTANMIADCITGGLANTRWE